MTMGSIDAEIVRLGASKLDPESNVQTVQGKGPPLSKHPNHAKSYDDVPVMSQLGVTAMPYPATDDGAAQGLMCRNISGAQGILVGARDTRTAAITKALAPGDTCLHSTGPNQAAQVQLKEKQRISALLSKDADGNDIGVVIDGVAGTITFTVAGAVFQMGKDGIKMATDSNAFVTLTSDGKAQIAGSQTLLGPQPKQPVQIGALPVIASGPGAPSGACAPSVGGVFA